MKKPVTPPRPPKCEKCGLHISSGGYKMLICQCPRKSINRIMETPEEEFPDKDKMYLSPNKESIMIYVEGAWKSFIREDVIEKHFSLSPEEEKVPKLESDWIEIRDDKPINITALEVESNSVELLFENGEVHNYNSKWPFSIATHYRILTVSENK